MNINVHKLQHVFVIDNPIQAVMSGELFAHVMEELVCQLIRNMGISDLGGYCPSRQLCWCTNEPLREFNFILPARIANEIKL